MTKKQQYEKAYLIIKKAEFKGEVLNLYNVLKDIRNGEY